MNPITLAIDIGGTGLKRALLGPDGAPLSPATTTPTPRPARPDDVVAALVHDAPRPFDRVSVGFPGVVVDGCPLNAPNLDGDWAGFPLAARLSAALGAPTRVANDADVQGYGAIEGHGVELVLTLGTGMGSALFVDGQLVPNLELGHHPLRDGATYEQLLGKASLERDGHARWRLNLDHALQVARALFNPRRVALGGGHAQRLADLPDGVVVVPNEAGLWGGLALWGDAPRRR